MLGVSSSLLERLRGLTIGRPGQSWEGLEEDPITRRLGCVLVVGSPDRIAAKQKTVQAGSEGRLQAVRPAPGKLLLFVDWEKQVPEWLVDALFGFKEVSLGFEAVKYRIPLLFEASPLYDLDKDRTIVFHPSLDCPASVIQFYADRLSESDSRYEFSELEGDLVAMVSSSLLSDNVQHILGEGLHNYYRRRPDIRLRYVWTGSASARKIRRAWKLRIPDSFVIEPSEYDRLLVEHDQTVDVLPSDVKAAVVVEQLRASDDLNSTLDKCRKYITEELCTTTVVLLADVFSKRHNKKFDRLYTFKLINGRLEEEEIQDPEFVDLTPGIPDCRVYFCFAKNKFKHGNQYSNVDPGERLKLLCDAVSSGDLEETKKFTCGLDSVNLCDTCGRLPLVEACKSGNRDIVKWLLKEGADKELEDKHGIWPALVVATSPLAMLVSSRRTIGADSLSRAIEDGKEKLVSALLNQGVDPSAENSDGEVPLVRAAMVAKLPVQVFEHMVAKASRIDAEDVFGNTAFQMASRKRKTDYTDVLTCKKHGSLASYLLV